MRNFIPLRRRGSWLIAENASWQMQAVHGPFKNTELGREYFQVQTANEETLLISRAHGERGMRDLRLDSVLESKSA